jgi:hypothetical protein
MEVFVAGIAVRGPGLAGWAASRPVLAGEAPHVPAPIEVPQAAMLAANERRRAGPVTRLALAVAGEAVAMSGLPPGALRTVFGSANGDGATIHGILDVLSGPDIHVSPTQFHNSVHNAAAGYWSIGVGSTQAATCLGCHAFTAAATLLKAAAEARVERRPVLMCVYDLPMPEPLGACHPTGFAFGAALVLTPEPTDASLAALRIDYHDALPLPGTEAPRQPALAALAPANSAARLLRLLEALARGGPNRLSLALLDGRVDVDITPCSTAAASSP